MLKKLFGWIGEKNKAHNAIAFLVKDIPNEKWVICKVLERWYSVGLYGVVTLAMAAVAKGVEEYFIFHNEEFDGSAMEFLQKYYPDPEMTIWYLIEMDKKNSG